MREKKILLKNTCSNKVKENNNEFDLEIKQVLWNKENNGEDTNSKLTMTIKEKATTFGKTNGNSSN